MYLDMLFRADDPGEEGPHALDKAKSSLLLLSISCSLHKVPNPMI